MILVGATMLLVLVLLSKLEPKVQFTRDWVIMFVMSIVILVGAAMIRILVLLSSKLEAEVQLARDWVSMLVLFTVHEGL